MIWLCHGCGQKVQSAEDSPPLLICLACALPFVPEGARETWRLTSAARRRFLEKFHAAWEADLKEQASEGERERASRVN